MQNCFNRTDYSTFRGLIRTGSSLLTVIKTNVNAAVGVIGITSGVQHAENRPLNLFSVSAATQQMTPG